jgi:hypothetical protein
MISLSRTQRSDDFDDVIAELARAAVAVPPPAPLEEEVRVAPQLPPVTRRHDPNSDFENEAQLAAALRALRNNTVVKMRK